MIVILYSKLPATKSVNIAYLDMDRFNIAFRRLLPALVETAGLFRWNGHEPPVFRVCTFSRHTIAFLGEARFWRLLHSRKHLSTFSLCLAIVIGRQKILPKIFLTSYQYDVLVIVWWPEPAITAGSKGWRVPRSSFDFRVLFQPCGERLLRSSTLAW